MGLEGSLLHWGVPTVSPQGLGGSLWSWGLSVILGVPAVLESVGLGVSVGLEFLWGWGGISMELGVCVVGGHLCGVGGVSMG